MCAAAAALLEMTPVARSCGIWAVRSVQASHPTPQKLRFMGLQNSLCRNLEITGTPIFTSVDSKMLEFRAGLVAERPRWILTPALKHFCAIWWNPWAISSKFLYDTLLSFLTFSHLQYIPSFVQIGSGLGEL